MFTSSHKILNIYVLLFIHLAVSRNCYQGDEATKNLDELTGDRINVALDTQHQ